MSAGGIVPILAAVAAAKKRRQEQEEEVKMSTYNSRDLDGWEFKIVRSTFGRFSNYPAVQKVCQEEAETGWELVEKFDDYRLRFKRRVERRSNDHMARLDPYRTSPGAGRSGTSIGLILGIVLLLVGVAALFLVYKNDWELLPGPSEFLVIAVVVAIIVALMLLRRRR